MNIIAEHHKVIAECDKVIATADGHRGELNKALALVHYGRGRAKLILHKTKDAIWNSDPDIKYAIAALDFDAGIKYAIADFDTAIHINPNAAEAYYYRGKARLALDHLDSAIADFDTAIHINPKYVEAHHLRAEAKLMRERVPAMV